MKHILSKSRAAVSLFCAAITLSLSAPSAAFGDDVDSGYEVGLSMYSLRKLFKSGELHALDYPDFAKETFGITKIDVWSGAFPKGWNKDPEFLPALKKRAEAAGSEIFLWMAPKIDCAWKNEKARSKNLASLKVNVDQAALLGVTYVRIFVKIDEKLSEPESLAKAVQTIRPLADYAQSKGLLLAIEPTPPAAARRGSYLVELVESLGHESVKLMPDFGKQLGTDIYQGTADMMPHTAVVSAKAHEIGADGMPEEFDYPRLLKIIQNAGFNGIIAIEYEGKNLDPVEGVKAVQKVLQDHKRN